MVRRAYPRRGRSGGCARLVVAAAILLIGLVSFLASKEYNPITNEEQYVSLTPEQEIALGLEAAPQMIQQFGGLYPDDELQTYVDRVGARIVRESAASQTEYQFAFHLLADPQTINAFALPGGQIFITQALFERLQSEGQVAGVLAHEVGHVVARHSAQQIAKSELTGSVIGAVVIAASDPEHPAQGAAAAQVATVVGQLVNMKFGREDELQSDQLGVRFMAEAGYDPRSLIQVMQILAEAGGPQRPPEFFSTHPNPENRIQEIEAAIRAAYPNGVPEGLTP
jgi:predicted Zn-dependent protease